LKPQSEFLAQRGLVCLRANYRVRSRDNVLADKCVEDSIRHVRGYGSHRSWLDSNAGRPARGEEKYDANWSGNSDAFTSYTFNGYEVGPGAMPRITGKKLGAINNPAKGVLAGEWTAFSGGSWHPLANGDHPDLKNILSFVDGHISFTKIYWNGVAHSSPCNYEPPAGYDYDWDGE